MPRREKHSRRPVGRPTKKTDETIEALMRIIATGAPYMICCAATGISYDSFMTWKREDQEFAARVEQAAAKAALRLWNKIEEQADVTFASAAWLMERRWPELFSRPEVQLNLIQQNNTTLNALSITISKDEIREIEEQAEPARAKVREMFAAYRPTLGNGNGDSGKRTVDVEVLPSVKPEDLTPISRKEGEENSATFWNQFASGALERPVDKATAIYVAKTIVDEVLGVGRGNQAIVSFKQEPIAVADVISVIERLCGGPAGWQHLQRKAGLSK
jgi:hypothetical protein